MTDLLLQTTGNPSQYEVIKDGKIVGRIPLFRALRDQRKPWIWSIDLAFRAGHERCMASRRRAMTPCRRSPAVGTG